MRKRKTPKRPKNSASWFRSKLAWVLMLLVLVFLVQAFVFQDEGLYRLYQLKKQIKASEERIEALKVENARLEAERQRLLDDPEYLEKVAREKYRMAKPGEKVYRVIIETKKEQ
ncbi:MAG: septum formation initiator family protein [Candidatus Marinimicrobia bacterium]|nr:septum formation initiator family protein [Candidatus Neomarinimicrobiota bacterium]